MVGEVDNTDPNGKRRRLDSVPLSSTPSDYVPRPIRPPHLSTVSDEELEKQVKRGLQCCYPGTTGFRSEGQRDLLWACLRRKYTLAILPTGAGKSIAYELPPVILSAITVAIIPYRRILQQALGHACNSGIKVVEWVSATNPIDARNARLILVSIEAAVSQKFKR